MSETFFPLFNASILDSLVVFGVSLIRLLPT